MNDTEHNREKRLDELLEKSSTHPLTAADRR